MSGAVLDTDIYIGCRRCESKNIVGTRINFEAFWHYACRACGFTWNIAGTWH